MQRPDAKILLSTVFHMQYIRRKDLRKFIEFYMETPCWCPSGWVPTWWTETNRNNRHWVLLGKRAFISGGTQNIWFNTFLYKNDHSDRKMTQNKSFLTYMLDSSLSRMLMSQQAKTEIQANSITKRRTLSKWKLKICININLSRSNKSWK